MERTEVKWLAGTIGLLVIIMFFIFSNSVQSSGARRSLEDFLTVSMPRPIKEMILGFTLAGRTIKREIETTADTSAISKNENAKANPGSATKAVIDKGQAAKRKAAAARAARLAQEREFRARIVAESERYRRFLQDQELFKNSNARENSEELAGGKYKNKNANNVVQADETDNQDNKLDPAAWKSLVLAQPTTANVQKMIQAYLAGDLDAQTYYEIVDTLMKDNSEDKRKMGLWALTSTYHGTAFSMASNFMQEADTDTQKRLNDYMYSYNRAQSLGILDQVLQSSDSVAANMAAQVITKAVESLKVGQQTVSGQRSGRQQTQGQALTLSSYQRFIPTLQLLATRTGSELSQWAQNLLSQLRSNTSAA